MTNKYFSALLLIFICNIFVIKCENDDNVQVRVKNGQIIGKRETFLGKELDVFLGIPYAEPPVGSLRFKRPVPVKEWSAPIEAFEWPNPCHQTKMVHNFNRTNRFKNKKFEEMSEDCLYLNIWTPVNVQNINEDNLKAVMFWIHGGALYHGSSIEYQYNGEALAMKGDVVVVTFNYRLNTFGFLYTGTEAAPGNAGLWDQALALEWVNDNIRYFGGDPNRITIFGESAGSWSVSLHLLSPITRNLFQNAIMMSGAALTHMGNECPKRAKRNWFIGAQYIGCGDDDSDGNDGEFSSKMIECLMNANEDDLVKMAFVPELQTEAHKWLGMPVIDGNFIPERVIKMLEKGDYKKNVNLMAGTTSDEGSFILSYIVDPRKYHPFQPYNFSLSEASDELKRLSSMILSDIPVNTEDVAKVYFTGISANSEDYDLLRRTIGIALGDFYIGCPTYKFAQMLYSNDQKGSKVYQYYYNSKLGEEKFLCAKWMGTCHCNDLWPTFGMCFRQPHTCLDVEREEAEQVIEFFTHFAKHGKPSPQNEVKWPSYYMVNDNVISPYFELTNEGQTRKSSFKIGLKIVECEYLWQKYINVQ